MGDCIDVCGTWMCSAAPTLTGTGYVISLILSKFHAKRLMTHRFLATLLSVVNLDGLGKTGKQQPDFEVFRGLMSQQAAGN